MPRKADSPRRKNRGVGNDTFMDSRTRTISRWKNGAKERRRYMAAERLQKIMAACGVASRRGAEEIIAAGRVTVNGEVVREQGTKADAARDVICVDGVPLKKREKLLYFLLNKPKGYVTTVSDPEGRPTVMELMKDCPALRGSLRGSGQARARS